MRVDSPLTLRNWLDARGVVLATAEKRWPERRAREIREAMVEKIKNQWLKSRIKIKDKCRASTLSKIIKSKEDPARIRSGFKVGKPGTLPAEAEYSSYTTGRGSDHLSSFGYGDGQEPFEQFLSGTN